MIPYEICNSSENNPDMIISKANLSGFEMEILKKYGQNPLNENNSFISSEKIFLWVKNLILTPHLLHESKIPCKVIILKKVIEYDYENFPEFSFGLLEIELMKKLLIDKEMKEKRFYIFGHRKVKQNKRNPEENLHQLEIYYLAFYQTPVNLFLMDLDSNLLNSYNQVFDIISDYLDELSGNYYQPANSKFGCFLVMNGKLSCELLYVFDEIKSVFYQTLKDLSSIISKTEMDKKELSWVTVCFGMFYRTVNDLDNAMLEFSKALSLRNLLYGEFHQDVADSIEKIGTVKMDWKKYEEAVTLFKQVYDIRTTCLSEIDSRISDAVYNIGIAYLRMNNLIVSRGYFDISLKILEKAKAKNFILSLIDLKIANTLQGIAFTYFSSGKWSEMLEFLFKSYRINLNYYDEEHSKIASLTEKIAFIFKNLKEEVRAYEYGVRTYKAYLKLYGKDKRTQISLKFLKDLRNFRKIKRIFLILATLKNNLKKTYKRRLIIEEILLKFI